MRAGRLRRGQGFTLIEMLVVIAIIGILCAISFPMIFTTREAARRRVCMNNLRQIGMAIQMYAADYGGRTPPMPRGESVGTTYPVMCVFDADDEVKGRFGVDYTVADVLMDYVGDRSIFRCPSYVPSDAYDECVRPQYVYTAPGCNINWGHRDDPHYGDPSHAWLACDVRGEVWGTNHTFRNWAEVYYVNVLYMDGHVSGQLKAAPGTPGPTWNDPIDDPPHGRHDRGERRDE